MFIEYLGRILVFLFINLRKYLFIGTLQRARAVFIKAPYLAFWNFRAILPRSIVKYSVTIFVM